MNMSAILARTLKQLVKPSGLPSANFDPVGNEDPSSINMLRGN